MTVPLVAFSALAKDWPPAMPVGLLVCHTPPLTAATLADDGANRADAEDHKREPGVARCERAEDDAHAHGTNRQDKSERCSMLLHHRTSITWRWVGGSFATRMVTGAAVARLGKFALADALSPLLSFREDKPALYENAAFRWCAKRPKTLPAPPRSS
jgi:hypothetical protein